MASLSRARIERWSGRLALALVAAAVVATTVRPSEGPPATAPTESPAAPLPGASIDRVEQGDALASFSDVLSDAGSVLVLGDSTGNDLDEWVALWAADATENRDVTLHYWNSDLERFPPARELGGEGAPLGLWNLSASNADATYPLEFLGLVEEAPDAVLVSFGHSEKPRTVADRVERVVRAVDVRWGPVPTALVLQNPSTTFRRTRQQATVSRLQRLARRDGLPLLDVYSVFDRKPDDLLRALLRDGTNPNAEGSRLWADAVEDLLGDFAGGGRQ